MIYFNKLAIGVKVFGR